MCLLPVDQKETLQEVNYQLEYFVSCLDFALTKDYIVMLKKSQNFLLQ